MKTLRFGGNDFLSSLGEDSEMQLKKHVLTLVDDIVEDLNRTEASDVDFSQYVELIERTILFVHWKFKNNLDMQMSHELVAVLCSTLIDVLSFKKEKSEIISKQDIQRLMEVYFYFLRHSTKHLIDAMLFAEKVNKNDSDWLTSVFSKICDIVKEQNGLASRDVDLFIRCVSLYHRFLQCFGESFVSRYEKILRHIDVPSDLTAWFRKNNVPLKKIDGIRTKDLLKTKNVTWKDCQTWLDIIAGSISDQAEHSSIAVISDEADSSFEAAEINPRVNADMDDNDVQCIVFPEEIIEDDESDDAIEGEESAPESEGFVPLFDKDSESKKNKQKKKVVAPKKVIQASTTTFQDDQPKNKKKKNSNPTPSDIYMECDSVNSVFEDNPTSSCAMESDHDTSAKQKLQSKLIVSDNDSTELSSRGGSEEIANLKDVDDVLYEHAKCDSKTQSYSPLSANRQKEPVEGYTEKAGHAEKSTTDMNFNLLNGERADFCKKRVSTVGNGSCKQLAINHSANGVFIGGSDNDEAIERVAVERTSPKKTRKSSGRKMEIVRTSPESSSGDLASQIKTRVRVEIERQLSVDNEISLNKSTSSKNGSTFETQLPMIEKSSSRSSIVEVNLPSQEDINEKSMLECTVSMVNLESIELNGGGCENSKSLNSQVPVEISTTLEEQELNEDKMNSESDVVNEDELISKTNWRKRSLRSNSENDDSSTTAQFTPIKKTPTKKKQGLAQSEQKAQNSAAALNENLTLSESRQLRRRMPVNYSELNRSTTTTTVVRSKRCLANSKNLESSTNKRRSTLPSTPISEESECPGPNDSICENSIDEKIQQTVSSRYGLRIRKGK